MREIKFRQYIPKVKAFHYWGFIQEGVEAFVGPMDKRFAKDSEQYIGLKDVNGKEIYEGDIVQYYKNRSLDTEKALMLVEYKGCMFTIPFEPQVYGNIYENPELLEGINDTTR